MTIERVRYDGPIVFVCDGKSCEEVDQTHSSDFSSALTKAKSHGWVAVKDGPVWKHFCRVCK